MARRRGTELGRQRMEQCARDIAESELHFKQTGRYFSLPVVADAQHAIAALNSARRLRDRLAVVDLFPCVR